MALASLAVAHHADTASAAALNHEVVHLVELPVGIPRPEIIPPAAKYGCQFRDDLLHILPALPLTGQLSDSVSHFLRRLRTWPPLHIMPPWMQCQTQPVHHQPDPPE